MSIKRHTILAVDDVEQNLDILVDALSTDYEVVVAIDGPSALEAATDDPPDLVLLDIMMPGMDGYEVCQRLKKMPGMTDVPIIFVTAMSDIADEMRGFEVGGEDYIIKPYNPGIVLARVEAHLQLLEARRSLKDMLDKTLKGAVHLLTDVLSVASPAAFGQSSRVRRLVKAMALELKLADAWRYELAAMLSQIGCITLPGEIINDIFLGKEIDKDGQAAFDEHPQAGAELLKHIPRLETVAQMVSRQCEPFIGPDDTDLKAMDQAQLGGQLIRIAVDYDIQAVQGKSTDDICQELSRVNTKYPPGLFDTFEKIVQQISLEMTHREITAEDVTPGMILDQDVLSDTGALVVRKGMEVSQSVYNILRRMGKAGKIRMSFRVLLPT